MPASGSDVETSVTVGACRISTILPRVNHTPTLPSSTSPPPSDAPFLLLGVGIGDPPSLPSPRNAQPQLSSARTAHGSLIPGGAAPHTRSSRTNTPRTTVPGTLSSARGGPVSVTLPELEGPQLPVLDGYHSRRSSVRRSLASAASGFPPTEEAGGGMWKVVCGGGTAGVCSKWGEPPASGYTNNPIHARMITPGPYISREPVRLPFLDASPSKVLHRIHHTTVSRPRRVPS